MTRVTMLAVALAMVLIAASLYLRSEGSRHPTAAENDGDTARAVLRNAADDRVGQVKFSQDDGGVHVKVVIDEPFADAGFHGFHVHANNDSGNGTGCVGPSFASADGHFKDSGQDHPGHNGDMPALLVNADGSAEAKFVTDRYSVADVVGRAVIVHLKPDNYANIPAARYQLITGTPAPGAPPGSTADQATLNTGDAGDRIACGVIEAN